KAEHELLTGARSNEVKMSHLAPCGTDYRAQSPQQDSQQIQTREGAEARIKEMQNIFSLVYNPEEGFGDHPNESWERQEAAGTYFTGKTFYCVDGQFHRRFSGYINAKHEGRLGKVEVLLNVSGH
ncbi:hypothetical protein KUCAC02_027501, partial [Chaenocephalus aceratus]